MYLCISIVYQICACNPIFSSSDCNAKLSGNLHSIIVENKKAYKQRVVGKVTSIHGQGLALALDFVKHSSFVAHVQKVKHR